MITPCATCETEKEHDDLYLIQGWILAADGNHIAAELDVCPDCANLIDCVVLIDDQGHANYDSADAGTIR